MSDDTHLYDRIPYESFPYPQAHPDRLATVATLLGVGPAAVGACRVLELGCGTGGHLLPMADQLPGSTFVGVDASGRQVAEARAAAEAAGLGNVTLLHRDIADLGDDPDDELGRFDYVIAHGVFSWVPRAVQEKMLDLCRRRLGPRGVAYISYNTLPGWRMRGIIRDIMLFRARGIERPADRLFHARALIDLLARGRGGEADPYALLLQRELELLRGKDEHYLLHEHLEDHNEPLYFHEFAARAAGHGLQYLGEADFGTMSPRNLPASVSSVLQGLATDVVELEQYMDFVRNRMFRQTLLVHEGVAIDREVPARRLMGLHAASPARPEGDAGDVRRELRSPARATFVGGGATTTTSDPVVKAALLHLGERWPRSVPVAALAAAARSWAEGGPAVVDPADPGPATRRLAETLLRTHVTGQVELSVRPADAAARADERPRATTLARVQAGNGGGVTNRRHEWVRLDELQRHVLRRLDGTRDAAALAAEVAHAAARGGLNVHDAGGERVTEAGRLREVLADPVRAALQVLADRALLLAEADLSADPEGPTFDGRPGDPAAHFTS